MKEIIIPAALMNDFRDGFPVRQTYGKKLSEISTAIAAVEGKSRVRTIDADTIINSLLSLENSLRIPKKAMENLIVHCDPNAQRFPNAYKYTPYATCFSARFHGGKWRITEIHRLSCGNNYYQIVHTDASRAAIVENFTQF